MWTDHTEYEEYQKLLLSTVVRYQHNNTLGKILSNCRYRKTPKKYQDIFFFSISHTPSSSYQFESVIVCDSQLLSEAQFFSLTSYRLVKCMIPSVLKSVQIFKNVY